MYTEDGSCCLPGWPIFLLQDFMRLFAEPQPSPEPAQQADAAASASDGEYTRARFPLPPREERGSYPLPGNSLACGAASPSTSR